MYFERPLAEFPNVCYNCQNFELTKEKDSISCKILKKEKIKINGTCLKWVGMYDDQNRDI